MAKQRFYLVPAESMDARLAKRRETLQRIRREDTTGGKTVEDNDVWHERIATEICLMEEITSREVFEREVE